MNPSKKPAVPTARKLGRMTGRLVLGAKRLLREEPLRQWVDRSANQQRAADNANQSLAALKDVITRRKIGFDLIPRIEPAGKQFRSVKQNEDLPSLFERVYAALQKAPENERAPLRRRLEGVYSRMSFYFDTRELPKNALAELVPVLESVVNSYGFAVETRAKIRIPRQFREHRSSLRYFQEVLRLWRCEQQARELGLKTFHELAIGKIMGQQRKR